MPKTSYSDLIVVHRYLDEITTFIQDIVKDDKVAIMLACQVFEAHKNSVALLPFATEEDREQWLILKARDLANKHLKWERHEKAKTKAIRAAIHDCP